GDVFFGDIKRGPRHYQGRAIRPSTTGHCPGGDYQRVCPLALAVGFLGTREVEEVLPVEHLQQLDQLECLLLLQLLCSRAGRPILIQGNTAPAAATRRPASTCYQILIGQLPGIREGQLVGTELEIAEALIE